MACEADKKVLTYGHDMSSRKGAGAKSGRTTTFNNLSGLVAQVRASTQCPVFGTVL